MRGASKMNLFVDMPFMTIVNLARMVDISELTWLHESKLNPVEQAEVDAILNSDSYDPTSPEDNDRLITDATFICELIYNRLQPNAVLIDTNQSISKFLAVGFSSLKVSVMFTTVREVQEPIIDELTGKQIDVNIRRLPMKMYVGKHIHCPDSKANRIVYDYNAEVKV